MKPTVSSHTYPLCQRCIKYRYKDELFGGMLKCGLALEAEQAGVPVVSCTHFDDGRGDK